MLNERIKEYMHEIETSTPNIELLDPFIAKGYEDLKEFKSSLTYDVDLLLIIRLEYASSPLETELGALRKPIANLGLHTLNLSGVAYLRSKGVDAHLLLDTEELGGFINKIRIRKALHNTRVLVLTDSSSPSIQNGIRNLELIKERLGIEVKLMSGKDLSALMEIIDENQAKELAAKWIAEASEICASKESIIEAAMLYLAMKELLNENSANAITVLYGTAPAYISQKLTPCIPYVKLNDEGIIAACESDLNVLSAMIILSYLTYKPAFMGNIWLHDKSRNIIRITHDVPPLKMEGFDKPPSPYAVYDYHNGGYSATIYTEIMKGQEVTMARVGPKFDKILLVKGKVAGCYNGIYCRDTLDIEVKNASDFIHGASDYGHHFALVYGDYTRELEDLCNYLKLPVKVCQ